MASFNQLATMSFTKWFAVMDYIVSLGFETTKLPENMDSVTRSQILYGTHRTGLVGIKSSDNGKTITHALGWDMKAKFNYYEASASDMLKKAGNQYNSSYTEGAVQPNACVPYTTTVTMGKMSETFSEIKGNEKKQSEIMFAFGEWFDSVQAQLTTPSVFKSIDFTDSKGKGLGKLAAPLKPLVPFENAFDHLGLPKKLLKQLISPKDGLLIHCMNSSNKKDDQWIFNAPYAFACQLATGNGIAARKTDRKLMLGYFYNQGKYINEHSDPVKVLEYSGPRPFRYFGYPQSSILAATKYPSIALSTVTGEVTVPISSSEYYYSNNGAASEWQKIADPSAIITWTGGGKDSTPLLIVRSLAQYGKADKAGSRMHVNKINKSKVAFPSLTQATSPDYGDLLPYTAEQHSPAEFASIITAVADDPSPDMSTKFGAAPKKGATAPSGKPGKPIPSQSLKASTKKPSKPKREFSPDGVKVWISDFNKKDIFNMGTSWLVLSITPNQAIYNKIMKDQVKMMAGEIKSRPRKRKVVPPTNYLKQYPSVVQLAFKTGQPILINTNGKNKPEWKEYQWHRDQDAVKVSKDCRFSFIDDDPRNGMSFVLYTDIGTIGITIAYDDAGNAVTTVDEWFKDGATEMKVEVGPAKGAIMLPVNLETGRVEPSIHQLIDTDLGDEYFQRPMSRYPEADLVKDSYPDAWTLFGSDIEIDYFNADSLAKSKPLMFQAIPFDPATATEVDITKDFLEIQLFVEANTDTYTGFDYSSGEFQSERLVFPCDERYLALEAIVTDPATGDVNITKIEPARASGGNSIVGVWLSKEEDQAKIEFTSGETIIIPDEVNRGFSAVEYSNQQALKGLITKVETHPYPKGTGSRDLPNQLMKERTVKNIPVSLLNRMTYTDAAGVDQIVGSGGVIYEDTNKNLTVILPNPDPDKGLVKFKLVWKDGI